jgi:hypothetical protein
MSNEKILEEVLYFAHTEGIVSDLDKKANEYRKEKKLSFHDSYIQAYYNLKSDISSKV